MDDDFKVRNSVENAEILINFIIWVNANIFILHRGISGQIYD